MYILPLIFCNVHKYISKWLNMNALQMLHVIHCFENYNFPGDIVAAEWGFEVSVTKSAITSTGIKDIHTVHTYIHIKRSISIHKRSFSSDFWHENIAMQDVLSAWSGIRPLAMDPHARSDGGSTSSGVRAISIPSFHQSLPLHTWYTSIISIFHFLLVLPFY